MTEELILQILHLSHTYYLVLSTFYFVMGYIYAIIAAVGWGLAYALDHKILEKVSPSMLVLIHSIFSIIVLVPFIFANGNEFKSLTSLDKTTLKFIAASLITSLIAGMLILVAIQTIGAPKAAIFEIAYPFFVVIFAYFLFWAPVNWYFALGAVFLFIGSAIIVLKW